MVGGGQAMLLEWTTDALAPLLDLSPRMERNLRRMGLNRLREAADAGAAGPAARRMLDALAGVHSLLLTGAAAAPPPARRHPARRRGVSRRAPLGALMPSGGRPADGSEGTLPAAARARAAASAECLSRRASPGTLKYRDPSRARNRAVADGRRAGMQNAARHWPHFPCKVRRPILVGADGRGQGCWTECRWTWRWAPRRTWRRRRSRAPPARRWAKGRL